MVDPISDHLLDAVIRAQEDESKDFPMKMNLSVRDISHSLALRQPQICERKDLLSQILTGQSPVLRIATCQLADVNTIAAILNIGKQEVMDRGFSAPISLETSFRRGEKLRLSGLSPKSKQRQRHEQTINISAAGSSAGTHAIGRPLSLPFAIQQQAAAFIES